MHFRQHQKIRVTLAESEVLKSLLDEELDGLRETYDDVTCDRSLDTLEDLINATGSIRQCQQIVQRLRERLR